MTETCEGGYLYEGEDYGGISGVGFFAACRRRSLDLEVNESIAQELSLFSIYGEIL
jgi:hypothetical protein